MNVARTQTAPAPWVRATTPGLTEGTGATEPAAQV